MKMSVAYITSIRPGKKAGDATVHDLRAIEYLSDGVINFKLDLADGVRWEVLPQRIRIPQEPFGWVRLFDARQPIKLRRFNDLQAMKYVMPQCCHHFIDTLPHLQA